MGTKVTLRWRAQSGGHPGFQLYEDVLDSFGDDDAVGRDAPGYLRLDGVALDVRALEGGGACVTVVLPRELARELGLLQAPPAASPLQKSPGPA